MSFVLSKLINLKTTTTLLLVTKPSHGDISGTKRGIIDILKKKSRRRRRKIVKNSKKERSQNGLILDSEIVGPQFELKVCFQENSSVILTLTF